MTAHMDLFGRDADRAQVALALASPGVVTLLGPGGAGKTTLARTFDGLFVDASPATDEAGLRAAFAAALALPVVPDGSSLLGALAGWVERAHQNGEAASLVILDNVEQVIAPAAALASRLVAALPSLHLLVTSRERLRIAAERAVDIRPLAEGAGVLLFWNRAHRVRPELDPAAWRADAAEIVRLLDGLPLAIELAAARLRVLLPSELRARLSDRFRVLRSDRRDALDRHRSLEAALGWSWDLSTEPERAVLMAAAAVAGDAGLAELEAVADVDPLDLPDLLQALTDKSWLVPRSAGAGAQRFGLYESARSYLLGRLAAAHDGGPLWLRHDRWAVRHAARLGALADDGSLAAIEELRRSQQTLLRAAERWHTRPDGAVNAEAILVGLGPLFVTRGPYDAAISVLDAALSQLPSPAAALLVTRGVAERMRGDPHAARADLERAVSLAADQGAQRVAGRATAELGIVLHELGELDAAARLHEHAWLIAQQVGDRRGAGRALGSLAILHQERGRADDAQIHYEQALAVLESVGDARSTAIFLTNLAELHREHGRLKAARSGYEKALVVLEQVGDRRVEAVVLGNLGAIHHELGELDTADALRRRAIVGLTEVGDSRLRGVFLGALAAGALERGELGSALGHLDEALTLVDAAGDRRHSGLFRGYLGVIEARRGRVDAARAAFDAARTTLESVGDPALVHALSVHERHLNLAGARSERREGPESAESDEVRLAVRLLERALGDEPTPERAPLRLRVTAGAATFSLQGGDVVDLSKRRTLRLILVRLLSARLSSPGAPLPMEAILDAGWPGERVLAEAAANRVYVAINTLRKLGLRDALASREGGYLLDEDVVIEYQGTGS